MVPFVQPCSDTTDLVPRCPVLLEWSRVVSPRDVRSRDFSAPVFIRVHNGRVRIRFVSGCA